MKKLAALAVGFLLVGFAFAAAQEKTQEQSQAKAQVKAQLKAKGEVQQNKVQAKSEFRHRNKVSFIDENGDGINDLAKDADGDGIPNGQDPDWVKPEDGTGYKEQYKKGAADMTATADAKSGNAYQLARDDDGDGIPNGQDPDWVKPQDGTGYKEQYKKGAADMTATADAKSGNAYQLARDDDGDGIPNGQDPDWVKPEDGTGYKGQNRVGQPAAEEMTQGQKSGKMVKSSFGKGSFRQGTMAAGRTTGTGACDGTGPKGTAKKKGRG